MQAVIFGWKRNNLKKDLDDCSDIAKKLALKDFNIFTGGGGGFMMAGNKGCFEIDPLKSFAISVKCLAGKEGQSNIYYNKKNLLIVDSFAERKNLLFKNKDLYIFFPGGMGTIDEFSELITLFKAGELEIKPIILYNNKFWNTLKSWFEFNKINWPESYISCVINSVDEFNKYYDEIFCNSSLVKIDNNNDIENYKSITTKSNIFNEIYTDDLINEIFNDENFKKDIDNLLNNSFESNNDSSDSSNNEFIEIVIVDKNEDSKTSDSSGSLENKNNYDDINLIDYETDTESED